MWFVLWVTQKNNLQAKWAYSIFKYMKLKGYEKKNISNIFHTTLKIVLHVVSNYKKGSYKKH